VPETTRGALSFPFPPRTALIGLIAGILGYERNSYWKEGHSLRRARIAVEVIKPVRMYPMKVNYTQTKSDFILSLPGGLRILVPSEPLTPGRRGFTTQYRLDLLKNPAFRVYVNIEDEDMFRQLHTSLKDHRYVYPPYLGHANLFAELKYLGKYPFRTHESGQHQVTGLVPLSLVEVDSESFIAGDFHIVHGVPMSMMVREELPSLDGRYVALTEVDHLESVAFQVEGRQSPILLKTTSPDVLIEVSMGEITKKVVFLTGA